MRIFRNVHFSLFLLLVLVLAGDPASATTFTEVHVRQINPEGPVHTATCSDEYKTCYLTVHIDPENDKSINVLMRLEATSIRFHFMRDAEYLNTLPNGKDYIDISDTEKQEVTLYVPHPLAKTDSYGVAMSPVIRISKEVFAELEISVQPATEH